jgi:hypothetical protein
MVQHDWMTQHEQICAERYDEILRRIWRLELIVLCAGGSLIMGMAGVLTTLLVKV